MPAHFRSSHPDVLAYFDRWQAAQDAFEIELEAWTKKQRKSATGLYQSGHGYACAVGIKIADPNDNPGFAWKRSRDGGYRRYTPKLSTREGKALDKEVSTIRYNVGTVPGIPTQYGTAIERIGNVAFVSFSYNSPEQMEACESFNADLWQRCNRSDYFLAQEAQEAVTQ